MMTDENKKKAILFLKYLFAVLLSIIIWNFFIGNFIYNESVLDENSPAAGKIPYSKYVSGGEGFVRNTMDNYGFNNDFIDLDSDKIRVIVLGDSFTAASQLDRKYNFSGLLEERLNVNSDKYDVVNLGQDGRSMPEYLYYADDYRNVFQGDFFVLVIRPGDMIAIGSGARYYIDARDGNYEIIKNDYSPIVQKALDIKKKMGWWEPIFGYTAIRMKQVFSLKFFGNNKEAKTDTDEAADSADEQDLAAVIRWQLQELKKRFGENVLLVNNSSVPRISEGKVIKAEMDNDLRDTLFALCAEEEVAIIDTTDRFLAHFEAKIEIPFGFNNGIMGAGHFNKTGHKLMAEAIYDYLAEKLIGI